MNRTVLVLALAPALLATTCLRPVNIGVSPSPVRAPAFAFSQYGKPLKMLGEFAVAQCRPEALRRPVWRVARSGTPGDTTVPHAEREARDSSEALRITYGETPSGFVELAAPEPLAPGRCYLAYVKDNYGGGAREFRLLPGGGMAMEPVKDEYERSMRQLNRAAVHCRRSYARALRADTARIDGWTHAVGDTSITCASLRTEHRAVMEGATSREQTVLGGFVVAIGLAGLLVSELTGEK